MARDKEYRPICDQHGEFKQTLKEISEKVSALPDIQRKVVAIDKALNGEGRSQGIKTRLRVLEILFFILAALMGYPFLSGGI